MVMLKDGLQVNYLLWAFQGRRSLLPVRMGRIGRGFAMEEISELELWTWRGGGVGERLIGELGPSLTDFIP